MNAVERARLVLEHQLAEAIRRGDRVAVLALRARLARAPQGR